MAATEESILNLFDSFWFENSIFMKTQTDSPPSTKIPDQEIHEHEVSVAKFDELKLSRMPSLHVRSLSCDQLFNSNSISFNSDSGSPNSVLFLAPKLQTILSGKEVDEFEEPVKIEEQRRRTEADVKKTEYGARRRERRKNGGGSSKSLSDLEFEELKGCMDLGFVFSEEDYKDSSLTSIIPGLQRLGRTKSGEQGDGGHYHEEDHDVGAAVASIDVIPRPYLSEAWDVMDETESEMNPLMNWRIPAVVNEMDMKDHLRFWAHTVASVASTVR